jgi:hypothetical protein
MSAALGISLLCVAALWFAALLSVYRRPVPPRWARSGFVAELMTVGVLGVGVFGVAFLIQFALTAGAGGFGVWDGVLIIAALAGTVLLWRRVTGRPRSAAGGAVTPSGPREPAA